MMSYIFYNQKVNKLNNKLRCIHEYDYFGEFDKYTDDDKFHTYYVAKCVNCGKTIQSLQKKEIMSHANFR